METAKGPDGICAGDESGRSGGIPQAVGILVVQQPSHTLLDHGIVSRIAGRLERNQCHRRGSGIAVVVGTLPSAVLASPAGVEAPSAILPLQGENPA